MYVDTEVQLDARQILQLRGELAEAKERIAELERRCRDLSSALKSSTRESIRTDSYYVAT